MTIHGIPLPCLVVFSDPGAPPPGVRLGWRERMFEWALRALLRPGFRHCCVMVPMASPAFRGWLHVDPLFSGLDHALTAADTPRWVAAQADAGVCTAVWANQTRTAQILGFGPLTCVTAVKAVLGIRCRAITPYQLYRHLKRQESIMGGVFGGGAKAPEADNSYLEEQLALQKEQKATLEAENEARRRNLRARSGSGTGLRFTGTTADAAAAATGAGTASTLGG